VDGPRDPLFGEPAAPSEEGPKGPHASLPSFFESHFSGRAWKENVWDGYLTENAVLLPAGLAAGSLLVGVWDRQIHEDLEGTLNDNADIGNLTLGALIVGSVATGALAPGEGRTAWDETWTQAEAFGLSYGTTALLKTIVQKRRPDHSASRASFPSGHASAAFTAATLIDLNSGPELGIPAYALAGLTAYSRVETARHFPSDVLAGAAIGALSAGIVDALHFGRGRDGRGIARPRTALFVAPVPEGGIEVGVSLRF
jgi:hypothetical protein